MNQDFSKLVNNHHLKFTYFYPRKYGIIELGLETVLIPQNNTIINASLNGANLDFASFSPLGSYFVCSASVPIVIDLAKK